MQERVRQERKAGQGSGSIGGEEFGEIATVKTREGLLGHCEVFGSYSDPI